MERKKTVNYEKLKILTLGNSNVGKTCFIYKFTDHFFDDNGISTQGIDYVRKIVKHPNGKKYTLMFYDTAGQEKYRSVSVNCIKKCDGILLMYDITDNTSFESIPTWMQNIKDCKGLDFPIVLCGNKYDLENKRKIPKKDGESLAKKFGISFFETSNKDGTNIENAGNELIDQIIKMRKKKIEKIKNEFEIIDMNTLAPDIKELKKDTFELDINNLKRTKTRKSNLKKGNSLCS